MLKWALRKLFKTDKSQSQLEVKLWLYLKPMGFKQQVRIGSYWPDFVHKRNRLIVEVDGYTWHQLTRDQAARDYARTRFLTGKGYTVIRYLGKEITADTAACALEIYRIIMQRKLRR